jgi:hypothetical protein
VQRLSGVLVLPRLQLRNQQGLHIIIYSDGLPVYQESSMDARGFALQEILAVSPRPTERVSLGAFIQTTLEKVPATSSAEYGKNAWENALRREVLDFAVSIDSSV